MQPRACLAMPSWPWPSNSITAQWKMFHWYQKDCNPESSQRGWGVERRTLWMWGSTNVHDLQLQHKNSFCLARNVGVGHTMKKDKTGAGEDSSSINITSSKIVRIRSGNCCCCVLCNIVAAAAVEPVISCRKFKVSLELTLFVRITSQNNLGLHCSSDMSTISWDMFLHTTLYTFNVYLMYSHLHL